MGFYCNVNVLTNVAMESYDDGYGSSFGQRVDNYHLDLFKKQLEDPSFRSSYVERLVLRLSSELPDEFKEAIEYVNECCMPDDGTNSQELIFGVERPEEIKDLVRHWNSTNANLCKAAFARFERFTESKGSVSISKYLDTHTRRNGTLDIPTSMVYELKQALSTISGMFTYDSNSGILLLDYEDVNGDKRSCTGITMPDDVADYILKYPEEYVMINVMYD